MTGAEPPSGSALSATDATGHSCATLKSLIEGGALECVDGHALVVNADLPAATSDALRRLADAGPALVEAADGTTNALSLPDPSAFAPLYGPGSADRFRAHAGLATVRIPELELDVDSDADLERLGARLGQRTRALLAVPA